MARQENAGHEIVTYLNSIVIVVIIDTVRHYPQNTYKTQDEDYHVTKLHGVRPCSVSACGTMRKRSRQRQSEV